MVYYIYVLDYSNCKSLKNIFHLSWLICRPHQVRAAHKSLFLFKRALFVTKIVDIDNSCEQSKSNDQNVVSYFTLFERLNEKFLQASNPPTRNEKRSLPENVDVEMKKMKIETPVLESKVSTPAEAAAAPPKFVSASSMIQPIQEISDEELLEFVLKFEREHGIK